ncbi:MAG: D-2-hydroxyacid dehydrogenase, partial [Eggerthellaceae bacterium]|nr:D-2-hydroxyacid dehydrogenase [Eggerthellaceae bacterium]
YVELDELLSACDIVSIHVPVTPETTGLVDGEFIRKMKRGAILINTARGEIVDQLALKEAIISGHLSAAGLDTLHPEPVKPDNPLLHLPVEFEKRIVFSPHIGGVSEGMFYRAHKTVWENIERVVSGEDPIHRVN